LRVDRAQAAGAAGRWAVTRWRGEASEAHGEAWPPDPVPSVRVVDVRGRAVVLGSTQTAGTVDADAAAAAGLDVVRRRSGGGAVLVGPGELLWVDVFVPAGDRLWSPDVGRATHWLGAAWVGSLAACGVEASWHDGALVTTPWSRLVCFAGLGPGEVHMGGVKVVGLSQRRTREGALFSSAALLRWDPGALLAVLALDAGERQRAAEELSGAATALDVPASELETAVLRELAGL
jgi:lipoate-protein ligase A